MNQFFRVNTNIQSFITQGGDFYFDERGARGRVLSYTASESKSNYRLNTVRHGGRVDDQENKECTHDYIF